MTTRAVIEISFEDWKCHNMPMCVEAKLLVRGRVPHQWLYNLCMWALKKFCAVEVV